MANNAHRAVHKAQFKINDYSTHKIYTTAFKTDAAHGKHLINLSSIVFDDIFGYMVCCEDSTASLLCQNTGTHRIYRTSLGETYLELITSEERLLNAQCTFTAWIK